MGANSGFGFWVGLGFRASGVQIGMSTALGRVAGWITCIPLVATSRKRRHDLEIARPF